MKSFVCVAGLSGARGFLLCLSLTALLAGCGTVREHRARAVPTAFGSFHTEDQEAMLQGRLRAGWAPEAVYVALGEPEVVIERQNGEDWYYRGEVVEIEGEVIFRSRSEIIFPKNNQIRQIRVSFVEGAVVEWEIGPVKPGLFPVATPPPTPAGLNSWDRAY